MFCKESTEWEEFEKLFSAELFTAIMKACALNRKPLEREHKELSLRLSYCCVVYYTYNYLYLQTSDLNEINMWLLITAQQLLGV